MAVLGLLAPAASAQLFPTTWANPVSPLDFPDPDVIRVGSDYYLVCSTFSHTPGLTILHSVDLVHWQYAGHALDRLPDARYDVPQHGCGVWAPSIREHDGWYYIFWGDPDIGIYQVRARHPVGPWEAPVLVKPGKGLIDPCPLWDDDGQAYLIHALAASRTGGLNNVVVLNRMDPSATKVLDEGYIVIDANKLPNYRTLEGVKFYKYQDEYYIFAPAGGVEFGWQSVFRAKSVDGPYADRIVLAQGPTNTNGPHQGAWIRDLDGQDWFVHFQDRRPHGRIPHVQPMQWIDGWPVMGVDPDGDGTGQPVPRIAGAAVQGPRPEPVQPVMNDEFGLPKLGPQWQWEANHQADWYSLTEQPGVLYLNARPVQPGKSLWAEAGIVSQRVPGFAFTATTRVNTAHLQPGSRAGVVLLGFDYAWIGIEATAKGQFLVVREAHEVEKGGQEKEIARVPWTGQDLWLRITLEAPGSIARFAWSADGESYTLLGEPFPIVRGHWVGTRLGYFCQAEPAAMASRLEVDWIRVEQE